MKQLRSMNLIGYLILMSFVFVFVSCDKDDEPEPKETQEEQRVTKFPTDFLPYIGEQDWLGNLANNKTGWTENWIDDSSGTEEIQYEINEEGYLRFWTGAESKHRPKVMHKDRKIFTTGEYKWRVYIPEMGLSERVSIGAFLYNNGDYELDFEIGSGTSKARSKDAYHAFEDEILMYITSQNFPSHQFIHPIKVNAWYDLEIRLTENDRGNYHVQWFVNGYEISSTDLQYGKEVPFGIHCSLENLDFMGDILPTREHYVLFDKVSYVPYDPDWGKEDPTDPIAPKVSMRTSKEIGEQVTIRVDSESDVWIDLNNNKEKDENEEITTFGAYATYTLESQDFAIYGNLTRLQVQDNQLTALDISEQDNLNWLTCQRNELTELDVSQNTSMTYLNVDNNRLKELDLDQNNFAYLSCGNNEISSLDLSSHTSLDYLSASSNKLNTLELSNSTQLHWLDVSNNELTTLKMSSVKTGNTDWVTLRMHGNQINGVNMTNFVNSLANAVCELIIINTKDETEGNIATVVNVDGAKAKGWIVLDDNDGERVDYPGS